MRHAKAFRKFSRTSAHRRALLRNLATNLVLNGRITTTLAKAKELRRVADKLVTLGKENTLHSRRQALSYLQPINRKAEGNALKRTAVHKLFTELAVQFKDREGGYTRVVRLSNLRDGDKAPMAVIEFVEGGTPVKRERKGRRERRRVGAPPTETSPPDVEGATVDTAASSEPTAA